jgi:hypothetical protein
MPKYRQGYYEKFQNHDLRNKWLIWSDHEDYKNELPCEIIIQGSEDDAKECLVKLQEGEITE